MALHHWNLRHTPVTTHLAYVSMLLLFNYRGGRDGWAMMNLACVRPDVAAPVTTSSHYPTLASCYVL